MGPCKMQDVSFCADFCAPGAVSLFTREAGCGFVTGENFHTDRTLRIPELNSGFQPVWWHGNAPLTRLVRDENGVHARATAELPAGELAGRALPLWYKVLAPCEGVYRLRLTLHGLYGGEVLVFAGRRRLVWRGELPAGREQVVEALTDLTPIIPGGETRPARDDTLDVTVIGPAALLCLTVERVAEDQARRIFVLGDSTVTDQTAAVPYAPGTSYAGWGQMLPWYLPEGWCVSNHVHSGLTTESFEEEGHWAVVEPRLRPGDFCLMQFGHNDQKRPHLTARGGYTRRLRSYVKQVRARGAVPVLVTPLARNSWTTGGQYNDLLRDYAEAVFALGREENVPVIDLHGESMALIVREGLETAKQWFYPGDFTHTCDYGACRMAAFLAGQLSGLLGACAPARPDWTPAEPRLPLTPPEGCTLAPPAGGEDPIALCETRRPGEILTRMEALELVVAAMKFFPTNAYSSPLADIVGQDPRAVTVQTAIQNGIVPAAWTRDGSLHPTAPVRLGEFLAVLMPGYATRRLLPRDMEQQMVGDADRAAPLTRRDAAAICRKIEF